MPMPSTTKSLPANSRPSAGRRRLPPVLLALLLLGACSTSPNGRLQVTAPAPVSDVYSEVDMRLNLATADSMQRCEDDCTLNQLFDQQVAQTGSRLAQAAYALFPDLGSRLNSFEFVVADKSKAGSASNARGKIVIFRGVQQLQLNEPALAFLMAREMAHVIGQHHGENSATRVMIAVLAGVLFPVSNLFNGTAATQTAFSSTAATTAASSVTSYVGSKLALASLKPEQISEADLIALGLLEHLGWTHQDVAASLAGIPQLEQSDGWAEDFRTSIANLDAFKPVMAAVAPETPPPTDTAPETGHLQLLALATEPPAADSAPPVITESVMPVAAEPLPQQRHPAKPKTLLKKQEKQKSAQVKPAKKPPQVAQNSKRSRAKIAAAVKAPAGKTRVEARAKSSSLQSAAVHPSHNTSLPPHSHKGRPAATVTATINRPEL